MKVILLALSFVFLGIISLGVCLWGLYSESVDSSSVTIEFEPGETALSHDDRLDRTVDEVDILPPPPVGPHPISPSEEFYTEWMSWPEFKGLLDGCGEKIDGKNFWDKGHWVDTVDARSHSGKIQYRFSYSKVPANRGYWWYWYFNQDKAHFDARRKEMEQKGIALVHMQSFKNKAGQRRYQAVWHKLVE